jgi:hypothetical protein
VAFAGARVVVAMVYGDPVVGRALTTLLQGIGYEVRSIERACLEDPGEVPALLRGVQVLVMALWCNRHQADLLALLRREPSTASIRVVDLNPSSRDCQGGPDPCLPWPVRTGDLKRHVEGALAEGTNGSRQNLSVPEEKKEER